MYRSVLQQTAPLTVVAAQWSAGGAACKEEDLGHQASVGGRLWKQVEDLGHHQASVGGRLWKPSVGGGGLWTRAFSIWRALEACRLQKEGTLEAHTRKKASSR